MTSVDGMDDHVKELVAKFKDSRARLEQWKCETYPNGTVVYVECDQYTGHGIAARDSQCRPEQLSVRLENGNVWWYPVVQVWLATTRPGDWPLWIKREKKLT